MGNGAAPWVRLCGSFCVGLSLLLTTLPASAQSVELRGRVVDSLTRAAVNGAAVRLPDLKRYTYTNEQGWFRFSDVSAGRHRVVVQQLGYADVDAWLQADGVTDAILEVSPRPVVLEALVAHSGFLDSRAKRSAQSTTRFIPWRAFDRNKIVSSGITEPRQFLRSAAGIVFEPCQIRNTGHTCAVIPFYLMEPGIRGSAAGSIYNAAATGIGGPRTSIMQRLGFTTGNPGRPPQLSPTARVSVYLDDQPMAGGLDSLNVHTMSDMWRIETFGYRGESQIRFYTLSYIQKVATGELQPPINIAVDDAFEPPPGWRVPPRRR
jgi:hypothetical protein